MMEIVRDMERYCPNAVLLNYTNPMAMLCGALQRQTTIPVTGLCHSVQGIARRLAGWIGASISDVNYVCAGINHQAWYLKYEVNGCDGYPLIHKAITENPKVYNEEPVTNEIYLALGYYVTELNGHNSEYNWWFRKRPDLIEQYCTHATGWNPGEYAYNVKRYSEKKPVGKILSGNVYPLHQIGKNWREVRSTLPGLSMLSVVVNPLSSTEMFGIPAL